MLIFRNSNFIFSNFYKKKKVYRVSIFTGCNKINIISIQCRGIYRLSKRIVMKWYRVTSHSSSPSFSSSHKHTLDYNFRIAGRRPAYWGMTVTEARCTTEFVVRSKIEKSWFTSVFYSKIKMVLPLSLSRLQRCRENDNISILTLGIAFLQHFLYRCKHR